MDMDNVIDTKDMKIGHWYYNTYYCSWCKLLERLTPTDDNDGEERLRFLCPSKLFPNRMSTFKASCTSFLCKRPDDHEAVETVLGDMLENLSVLLQANNELLFIDADDGHVSTERMERFRKSIKEARRHLEYAKLSVGFNSH